MKVRVTIMTENDIPAENLNTSLLKPEVVVKQAWDFILKQLADFSSDINERNEKAYVEKVEILRED